MNDTPIELDKHRGMAAQKATDIRRVIAEVEANAKLLRDTQGVVEVQLLAVPRPGPKRRQRRVTSSISIRPVSRHRIPITVTSWRRCWPTSPGLPGRADEAGLNHLHISSRALDAPSNGPTEST